MKIKKLCPNCGSSFITEEAQREYDEIARRWEEKEQEYCDDCIKDLGLNDNA